MTLENINIIETLKKLDVEEIYAHRFFATYNSLSTIYYPSVVMGAMIDNPEMQLNDHGKEHVLKVIKHASNLIENTSMSLNVIELYVLLIGILFHDVGNLYSREEHEKNRTVLDVMKQTYAPLDTVMSLTVFHIVDAHGGRSEDGDKDKISKLDKKRRISRHDVNVQLVASILRFADELADDKERASIPLIKADRFLPKSKMCHLYSSTLEMPRINHNEKQVELVYYIDQKYIVDKVDDSYLIDTIYDRLYKMHLERIYCMRFMKPHISIDNIYVEIVVIDDKSGDFNKLLTLNILENGYPKENNIEGLFSICTELNENGNKKNGEYYMDRFQ